MESFRVIKVLKFFLRVMIQDAPWRRRFDRPSPFYANEFFDSPEYAAFEDSKEVKRVYEQMKIKVGPQVGIPTGGIEEIVWHSLGRDQRRLESSP